MFIIVRVVKGEINRVFNVVYSLIIVAHSKWLNVPILFLLRCPAETILSDSLIGRGNIHKVLFLSM